MSVPPEPVEQGWHTPYPEVNVILEKLLSGAKGILGDRFFGMYLYGSMACGDFDLDKSDVDFVVVTKGQLPDELVGALGGLHRRIVAGDSKWARKLEGSYIPKEALGRHDPEQSVYPQVKHDGKLNLERHDSDWVIQRHVLREHGVILAGPAPNTMIDYIGPNDLRQAVLDLLWWWEQQIADTSLVRQSPYQAYAVLSMCRILYTMEYGTIVSKPVAAKWAVGVLDERWVMLINYALAWQPDEPMDRLAETLDFMRYTLAECYERD
jgi:hypothetical protein